MRIGLHSSSTSHALQTVKLFFFVFFILLNYFTASAQNNALNFDGIDDRVDLPANILPATYTKEAWVRVNASAGFNNNIVSGTSTAFWAPASFGFQPSAGHNGTYNLVQDPTPLTVGTWTHIAVTYNATTQTMRLYTNGVLVSTATSVPNHSDVIQYIGSFNAGFFMNGEIDEVRIWNTERTVTEIANNRNCELTGDEPGLVAYYNFNVGVAGGTNTGLTNLPDVSDKCLANNGTLVNFALTGATSNWVAGSPVSGTCANTVPNIAVTGNSLCITDGDNTPSLTDFTDFGQQLDATPVVRTFTIQNTGTGTLNITGSAITGANAGDFTITTPPASSVAPAGSTTIQVSFLAGALGARTATLEITSDDGDESPFNFSIQGTGVASAKGLQLDGINDQVDLPNILSGSYTKEAWINSENFAGLNNNIISGTATAFWAPSSQGFRLTAGHTGNFLAVQDPNPLPANTWIHVAVTYDATTQELRLYRNGTQVASATSVAGYTETIQYIGAFSGANYFRGIIDEVRIWNVVRSAAEIAANINCELSGDEYGLIAYYNFNNGVAGQNNAGLTTLADISDKCVANNGTLVNFALNGTVSNWVDGAPALLSGCVNNQPNISITGNSVCIANTDNTPSATDFTDYGNSSGPEIIRTFTILNTGGTTLNIGAITITGANAGDFTVVTPPAATVAPGGSTTFAVQFLSLVLGPRNAVINVANDDADEQPFTFAVRGTLILPPLPVTLGDFTALKRGNTVKLNWTTYQEINNKGFSVEKSADGRKWQAIGFVNGAGNSSDTRNYHFTDNAPVKGKNYYRLVQVDDGTGKKEFSDVRRVDMSSSVGDIFIYPVPASSAITLQLSDEKLLNTELMIINITGQTIEKVRITSAVQKINISHLQNGMYFIKTADGDMLKMIKQ
jgi:hypothetical protein